MLHGENTGRWFFFIFAVPLFIAFAFAVSSQPTDPGLSHPDGMACL